MTSYDDIGAQLGLAPAKKPVAGGYDEIFSSLTPGNRPKGMEKAAPVEDFSGNLRFGPIDTGISMPEGFNRRAAQLGSGFADIGLAIRQIMAGKDPKKLGDLITGQTEDGRLRQEAADKRVTDAGLNTDFTGKALHFAGNALPLLAAPGGPVLSGMLAGAAGGALTPVAGDESRTANTMLGTALGGVIPGAIAGVTRMVRPSAEVQAAAQLAARYGIPVTPADLSSSAMVKGLRSFTNDIPLVGMAGQSAKAAQQEALNWAVGAQFGAPASKLTPDVVGPAKAAMGNEFDRIWGANNLVVDAPMFQRLQAMRSSAGDLPAAEAQRVIGRLDDFLLHATPGQGGVPIVPGEAANNFQQWLRLQAGGQSLASRDAGELRKTILDTFNRSNPKEAAALGANRSAYKAFKTVEPLLDKGVAGTAGRAEGDIPAGLLSEAVRNSYNGLGAGTSRPALADLAQVGSRFVADRTSQTGGSPRAMMQNLGLASIVPGAGVLAGAPPALAIGAPLGAMAGVNALLNSTKLGARLAAGESLTRPELQTLTDWLVQANAPRSLLEAVGKAGSRAPITGVPAWFTQPPLLE